MTSFRLSELPTPYRTSGASPLGTHEGTVTPPEPPTPTGLTYFSGTNVDVTRQDGWYMYPFDPAGSSNVSALAAKQEGDELSVTINGTTQTIAIAARIEEHDDSVIYVDLSIGMNAPTVPLIVVNTQSEDDVWSCTAVGYVSAEEIPGGVTLVIADPS